MKNVRYHKEYPQYPNSASRSYIMEKAEEILLALLSGVGLTASMIVLTIFL